MGTCPCPACKDMRLNLAPLLLLVATTRAAHWAGKSVFAGVGLGIGATTIEFTAELDLAGDRLTGTGEDKQGTFKLEGTNKNFVLKYDKSFCERVEYSVEKAGAKDMSGSYKFTECSTAQYKKDHPFAGMFAPATSSGAGTWSMACKSGC